MGLKGLNSGRLGVWLGRGKIFVGLIRKIGTGRFGRMRISRWEGYNWVAKWLGIYLDYVTKLSDFIGLLVGLML